MRKRVSAMGRAHLARRVHIIHPYKYVYMRNIIVLYTCVLIYRYIVYVCMRMHAYEYSYIACECASTSRLRLITITTKKEGIVNICGLCDLLVRTRYVLVTGKVIRLASNENFVVAASMMLQPMGTFLRMEDRCGPPRVCENGKLEI